ncbi:hypothetical protein IQ06DRAFT_293068 [Phaeosphaeriaceae sp. SRC1lsM3a]|nr:hypothetical protein IQ06DRAFT_293068 [Stagonospora sp. SRC1lsM3a]
MQIAVMAAILPFTVLAVVLRVYAKAFVRRTFDASDWSAVVGLISIAGYSYTVFDLSVIPGVGNHQYELRMKDIPERYYSNLIASGILLALCLYWVKLSLLLLIGQIFWVRKGARYLIIGATVITTIVYIVYFVLSMVFCIPRPGETAMQILVGIGTSRCLNILTLSAFLAGFNAVSDVFVLAVSVPILMGLQTSLSRRLRASALFCLGLTATVISIVSAYYRIRNQSTDGTWDYTTLFILGYYEICLGMICACLPTLPILGQSAVAQRILSSRLFSLMSSNSSTRSRSKGSTREQETKSGNSSTTKLAHEETHGSVTITREFDVENSYQLYPTEHGFQKSTVSH